MQQKISQFQRRWLHVYAVGKIFQAVTVSADADFPFNPVIVRSHVGIIDGPVSPRSVDGVSLEIPMTQAQGHGVPEHCLTPDAASTFGAKNRLTWLGDRDMPVRKIKRKSMGVEVGAGIHRWAALYQRNLHSALSQMTSERAPTCA